MNTRRLMAWLIFWSSVALALGALAWVSVEVVALERREADSRDRAVRAESIRRALWRLDSMMAPLLAIESARPPEDFVKLQTLGSVQSTPPQSGEDRSPPPVPQTPPDPYALSYFNTTESVEYLYREPGPVSADPERAHAQPLDFDATGSLTESDPFESDFEARNRVAQIASTQNYARSSATEPLADAPKKLKQEIALGSYSSPPDAMAAESAALPDTSPDTPPDAFVARAQPAGSLTPRWVRTGGEPRLVLVRDAVVDDQPVQQGLELDWARLNADLLSSISDVLPGATLAPSATTSLGAYRMATIPVVLVPPARGAAPVWSWSPARVGLVVTWVAIIATVIAVGMVLRAAIVLSERRGHFVSAVTHELRTPLTTFRLYAQMLADGMVSDEQSRTEYLGTLKRESERLSGIVENVLEYARLSRARSGAGRGEGEQTLSPGALIARFRPALARRLSQDNMDLVVALDLDEHQHRTVSVDPQGVERIMMNLIENACKYASPAEDDAGETEEHDTRVHLDVSVRDSTLELLVADHGPGVPASERARVFGEFQRGRRGLGNARSGLGLGLALSRGLAREMGGDLVLTRRRNHGAEFLLTIPLNP